MLTGLGPSCGAWRLHSLRPGTAYQAHTTWPMLNGSRLADTVLVSSDQSLRAGAAGRGLQGKPLGCPNRSRRATGLRSPGDRVTFPPPRAFRPAPGYHYHLGTPVYTPLHPFPPIASDLGKRPPYWCACWQLALWVLTVSTFLLTPASTPPLMHGGATYVGGRQGVT